MSDLRKQVDTLMDYNQALKAWDLVKDTEGELKDKVWGKVEHAFDEDVYKKYYSKTLKELPLRMETAVNCVGLHERLDWVMKTIIERDYRFFCDLGCADGYLGLTLGRMGYMSVGVNLNQESIDLANHRAALVKAPAYFVCEDMFDHVGKYEAAVMLEVIEHLPDPIKGIENALSLVREGGSLFISTPRDDHVGIDDHLANKDREGWDDGVPAGHLRLWSEKEFRELVKDYSIKHFSLDHDRCMLVEIAK